MVRLPLWLVFLVSLGDVEIVGGDVHNEHGLFVNLIDSKTGILALVGGGWGHY